MDYLDRLIHKLRTDNYGDNPPIKLGLWEFGLLPIYNEFVVIVDDERYEFIDKYFEGPNQEMLIEAYYMSKGAEIMTEINRILFPEMRRGFGFDDTLSFLYPIEYVYDVGVANELNDNQDIIRFRELLLLLSKNNGDLIEYLGPDPNNFFIQIPNNFEILPVEEMINPAIYLEDRDDIWARGY
jgi:hypothetical protein